MSDINQTLAERGARYGRFEDHAKISQGLLDVIRRLPAWEEKLDPDMRQALSTIFDKVARIMNGDPYYEDNWHDIIGYAKLVEDRIRAMNEQKLFEPEPDSVSDIERASDRDYIESIRPDITPDYEKMPLIQIPENSESFKRWQESHNRTITSRIPADGYSSYSKVNDPNYDVGNYRG